MQEAEKRFGQRYEFAFQYEAYVRAQSRVADVPRREEGTEIFKVLRFGNDGRPRANSRITYLNLYDREGKFRFQVYWDPQKSAFGFSDQQFY